MNRTQKITYGAASLIMALFRAWSLYFYRGDQAAALSLSGNLVLFSLRSLFYTLLFFSLFAVMQEFFINRRASRKLFEEGQSSGPSGKIFLTWSAILAAAWLPHMIIKYPGAMCWDSWQMLTQYRHQTITNFHSPYYSVLIGFFTDLFMKSEHAEVGLYLFAVLHYLVFVLVFGYSLWLLRVRMGARRAVCMLLLLCYALCPYIIGYLGVISKDCLYSAFVFLFLLCLLDCFLDPDSFRHSWGKNLLLVIAVVNVVLIRRNGLLIILAAWICLLLSSLIRKKGFRLSAVIALALGLTMALSSVINHVWSVENAGKRDAFSMCFQQTARYVTMYQDEISEEEADIIRAVLPYDELPSLYDPRISDPVKSHYNPTHENAMKDWLRLWAKWFFRHPGCYFSAVMEQNYYLFTPEVLDNISLYRDVDVGYELGETVIISRDTPFFEPIFHEPTALQGLKEAAVREYMLLHAVPVTRWLGNCSFWFYLLLFFAVFAAVNGVSWLILFMPEIVTVGIVIISPVIYGHPRYMFPVIYGTPILILYVLYETAKKKGGEASGGLSVP